MRGVYAPGGKQTPSSFDGPMSSHRPVAITYTYLGSLTASIAGQEKAGIRHPDQDIGRCGVRRPYRQPGRGRRAGRSH